MRSESFDAIVVGARCAGSPLAMLLARRGRRVLLVDKARFPSDTLSTHLVHPPGVAALRRWGLLERLEATGCPPIERYSFDFGPVTIAGTPRPVDGVAHAYCPRRTVLDELLVEAAVEAGAELREGFVVDELLVEDGRVTGVRSHARRGGAPVVEHAAVTVGADGRHSIVARTVRAEPYDERPSRASMYYAYWSDLPTDGFETTIRAEQHRGWAMAPTHDGLTVMPFGWPIREFRDHRSDVEGAFLRMLDTAPAVAERARAARRVTRFAGTAELAGWFRRPYGPGWALVGDAGYHKNPITAMGISDAFRDAELVAAAIDDALAGRRSYEEGMAAYRRTRDEECAAMYALTDDFATLDPPPPDVQRLIGATAGSQEAMDDFVSVQAATLPPPAFFGPENAARIMQAAGAAAPPGTGQPA